MPSKQDPHHSEPSGTRASRSNKPLRPPLPDVDQVVAAAEEALRDGAYVAVGLGVLAFQRAQVRRRQLARELGRRREEVLEQMEGMPFGGPAARVAAHLGEAAEALSARLDEVGRSLAANGEATRAQLQDLAKGLDQVLPPTVRDLLAAACGHPSPGNP